MQEQEYEEIDNERFPVAQNAAFHDAPLPLEAAAGDAFQKLEETQSRLMLSRIAALEKKLRGIERSVQRALNAAKGA